MRMSPLSTDKTLVETRPITKEEAEACANEQVQYISAVQPHGFLMVVDPNNLHIVQHSANCLGLINSVRTTPLPEDAEILNTPLSKWLALGKAPVFHKLVEGATQIFTFGADALVSSNDWECLGVLVDDYVCLEFFPATSKLDSYDLLINLDRMVARIRGSSTLDELFQVLVQEFQSHVDYDRVMLYRFLPDWSGEVVAEAVSEHAEVSYLGMRFPAEDIPGKARELYKISSLRIMADVDAEPSPLVPNRLPNGEPLDQSVSVLRSMSKMHVAYLKNMNVKASMSIALMSNDKLWGLVAFHHYTAKVPPNHLVSEMKASCELFTDIVISHINPTLDLVNIQRSVKHKQIIEQTFKLLRESSYDIHALKKAVTSIQRQIDKTYVGVCLGEKCYVAGGDWQGSQLFASQLQEKIKQSGGNSFESSVMLDPSQPSDLNAAPDMAGICAIQSMHVLDLVVFFGAQEVEQVISWGGKPDAINIVIKDGERQLEPRSSFALWRQEVLGHSDPWEGKDREILGHLMTSTEDFVLHCKSEQVKITLHETSYTDNLTSLPNRRYLEESYSKLSIESDVQALVTVFFLDLDNFKRINDFMGHQAGDILLKEVADRLKNCVRPDDIVARYGGDEFVVIVQHASKEKVRNHETAVSIAEKIIHAISQPVFDNEQPMISTASVGAVLCRPNEASFGDVLQQADIAMYRAKNAGKNRVHFFNAEDQNEVYLEVRLEIELRKALKQGDIEVFFQPIVNQDREIVAAEALARWNHHEIGYVSPEVFIPLAEKNNLICELGTQVMESVCQQLVKWRQDIQRHQLLHISINVSPAQLLSPNFVESFSEVVIRYGLSMSDIRLEITETLFMENFDGANEVLRSLRNSGVTVSLDDFGTGYSSLSYLWKLPIDEVKVDRSFVENMNDSNESLTMVEGIISLCKKMNLEIVAEGVEERVQVVVLKGLGCDSYQGYHFGKPVDPSQFDFQVTS